MKTSLKHLLDWYDTYKRDLPWRRANADPYAVWLSEIMLQQTTVNTVKPRFTAFLARFPSIDGLARADLDDVLHAWQGLGYYRRARQLHAAAQKIINDYGGRMPETAEELQNLPGIGRYTAAAIAAIAFDEAVVPVDGNIARIVSRLWCLKALWPSEFDAFQEAADGFCHPARPGDTAQALMDLGAQICRPKSPNCAQCPLAQFCHARQQGVQQDYPRKTPKKAKRLNYAAAFIVRDKKGRIQLVKRPENGLLAGLIDLPSTPWLDKPLANTKDVLKYAPQGVARIEPLNCEVRHVFTHIDLKISLFRVTQGQAVEAFWQPLNQLAELALSTMTRKLLKASHIQS